MEDRRITELAKAGGICRECGGLHTPEIECAILGELVDLPLCTCPDCLVCARVRNALEALEEGEEEEWQQQTTS